MIRYLTVVAFCVIFQLNKSFSQNNSFPKHILLNKEWKFIADERNEGLNSSWNQKLPENAKNINIPHTWNVTKGLEEYYGLAWYEHKLNIPKEWKNKHIRLKFDAIYHSAVIYLNGKKIADHLNAGYTAFYVDISNLAKYGEDNTLTISADNSFSESNIPYKNSYDWTNDGGIIRDVHLFVSARPSIRYVHVDPIINFADTSGKATVKIKLWEDEPKKCDFRVTIKEKKTNKEIFGKQLTLNKNNSEFKIEVPFSKVNLWELDHPSLYQIEVKALKKGLVTDEKSDHFGFRKIEVKGKQFFLNNEPVRLTGMEYTPSSHPDYGAAEPKWVMDSVANMFNDLNVRISRIHWQSHSHLLNLFDEKGILLQEEIPWWQQPKVLDEKLTKVVEKQLKEMIEEHYNHPSIFAWGLSNEVGTSNHQQYTNLKQLVKSLDPNRIINIVANNTDRGAVSEAYASDIPTWNDYIGSWKGKQNEELPEYLAKIENTLGDRPLLITEAGLCEPNFAGGDLRRVSDMLYHFNEWAKRDYIMGAIYFCINDYRTHMGENGSGRFKTRIHGLTDIYLRKKPSYAIHKQLTSPVEIKKVNRLSISSVEVTLFNKNSLPSYTLKGYKIKWKNEQGHTSEKQLGNIIPGQEIQVVLESTNADISFEIISPLNVRTTGYPLAVPYQ